jgi:hypothetical protein
MLVAESLAVQLRSAAVLSSSELRLDAGVVPLSQAARRRSQVLTARGCFGCTACLSPRSHSCRKNTSPA